MMPSDTPPVDTSPSASRSSPGGLPRAVWAIGALVFFIVAFGVGYMAGGAPIGDLNERVDQLKDLAENAEAERLEQVEGARARTRPELLGVDAEAHPL